MKNRRDGLIVDLFAGGGGASAGIEAALGRPIDVAVNHSAIAIAVHELNHPDTRHYETDVFDVDPIEATGGDPVALLWASPDCFVAGTQVLTSDGYSPIEEVKIGTLVYTHRGRWRRVVATMRGTKPVVRVNVQGHPDGLVCSEGHKHFAARGKGGVAGRIEARDLGKGDYLAAPRSIVPAEGSADAILQAEGLSRSDAWLLGRFVADGWAHPEKGITITVGPGKADATEERLSKTPLRWSCRETNTAVQFVAYRKPLANWLRKEFGELAHGKRIPGWVLTADESFRLSFLKGYVAGDGHHRAGLIECSTVSRELAFGIRTLSETLGYTVSAYRSPQRSDEIEGRKVNVQPWIYTVKIRARVSKSHRQQFETDAHRFYPVRDVETLGGEQTVYNITVDEDRSYVVEGVVTWNCTHFSVAKGDVPRDQGIRSLAWVVVKWARAVRPRTIVVENVREFQKWGPLGKDGRPDKSREGETFERWTNRLRGFGYRVEWRVLDAAEYGAPTCRKRLFIVARCDGLPIRWPAPTHGDGLEPYRTAAECIDWSIACPSIFERKKPLAEKTLKRIATGIRRYVLDAAEPFIVKVNHGGDAFRGQAVDGPLSTVTATQRSHALAVPTLIQTGYGERKGQSPRVPGLDKPLGTVVAGGAKHALCAALLTKHFGGVVGHELTRPVGAVTGRDHHAITAAHLVKFRGQCTGAALDQPMPTITAGGLHIAEVRALMSKHAPSDGGLFASASGSVRINGMRYQIADISMRMLEPHELLRAQFGDFADRYRMDATKKMRGRRVPLSKADRVRLIGNSVVPDVACALVSTLSRADRAAEVA